MVVHFAYRTLYDCLCLSLETEHHSKQNMKVHNRLLNWFLVPQIFRHFYRVELVSTISLLSTRNEEYSYSTSYFTRPNAVYRLFPMYQLRWSNRLALKSLWYQKNVRVVIKLHQPQMPRQLTGRPATMSQMTTVVGEAVLRPSLIDRRARMNVTDRWVDVAHRSKDTLRRGHPNKVRQLKT